MQPGDTDTFLGDMPSDSDEEGSSFFGGGSSESDADEDQSRGGDGPDLETGFAAQHAERAQQHPQQQPRQQQHQQPSATAGAAGNINGVSAIYRESISKQPIAKEQAGSSHTSEDSVQKPSGNQSARKSAGVRKGFLNKSTGTKAAAVSQRKQTAQEHSQKQQQQQSEIRSGVPDQDSASRGPSTSREDHWETMTATDSDDEAVEYDDDAAFMEQYGQALEQELALSRMAASFDTSALRKGASVAAAAAARAPAAAARARAAEKGKGKAEGTFPEETIEDMGHAPGVSKTLPRDLSEKGDEIVEGEEEDVDEDELRPVDVDVNLVQSLLASYAGQQGLPGPVSNLAGLMGIHLPDDKDSSGKSPFDAFMS